MRKNEDIIAIYSRKSKFTGKEKVSAIRSNSVKNIFVCIMVMQL